MSRACHNPAHFHKSCLIWDPPLSLVSSCTPANLCPLASADLGVCQHFARSWVLGVSSRLHSPDLEVFELVHVLVHGRRIRVSSAEDRREHFLETGQNNKDTVRSNYNSCKMLDNRVSRVELSTDQVFPNCKMFLVSMQRYCEARIDIRFPCQRIYRCHHCESVQHSLACAPEV